MLTRTKPVPPPLGTRITASGRMVRYRTPCCEDGIYEQQGCRGWRRKAEAVVGVYVGMRRLGISWWSPSMAEEDREYSTVKAVGGFRVYAVAINHQTIRYILPRDVEPAHADAD